MESAEHCEVSGTFHFGKWNDQEVGADTGTIIPMSGEVALASPGELQAYASAAASSGVNELHFYAADESVPVSVFQSIAAV
jgi:hypothetical protein